MQGFMTEGCEHVNHAVTHPAEWFGGIMVYVCDLNTIIIIVSNVEMTSWWTLEQGHSNGM